MTKKYVSKFLFELETTGGFPTQDAVMRVVFRALIPISRHGDLTMTSWCVSEEKEELTEESASDPYLTCASCSADAHEED